MVREQLKEKNSELDRLTPLIFISYAKEDENDAYKVYNYLKKMGFKPWLDKENLLPGQEWDREIRTVVRKSDIFLLCLSKRFVSKRGYRQREVKMALKTVEEMPPGSIYLIPVRLEDCDPPEEIKQYHYFDLFISENLDKLAEAILTAWEKRKR